MTRQMSRIAFIVALVLVSSSASSQTPSGLRGFTPAHAETQRQTEERFRALPNPENLRKYMELITETPHHAGSPASRKVAEYVLSQFKSW